MHTIFVIDDDESVVNILKDVLQKHFPSSFTGFAMNGNEAVTKLLEVRPDIVLIDYLLPDKDGLQIIKEVKQVYQPSFIMLSQISDKAMIAKAYHENIEFFISKPINVIEVISVVERVMKYNQANQTISQLESIFHQKLTQPESPSYLLSESNDLEKLKKLYSKLGIIGNNGSTELIEAVLWVKEKGIDYSLSDLYTAIAKSHGELQAEAVKKRITRVVNKTFKSIVHIGMEDNLNPIYENYATQLFNFAEIRKEMQCLKGKGTISGKVNIRQFIESSIVIIEDMK